ncbi:MAG: ATP-binding cassette domain-containing protein [Methylobacteriaceae bacterium]|nr:ATP-binding cassette domain-containing protein [Methylobacteriaceae bacterium]
MKTIEKREGLVLEDVRLVVEGRLLVDLSLTIGPGEIVTILAPSGAGKSSLLAAIAGTLAPAFRLSGRMTLDGQRIDGLPPEARGIGILFQDDLLFPHLSVGGNLAFGLPAGLSDRVARQKCVEEALATAGLAGMSKRDPATLSGGQRARVSMMRLILSEPQALLLDEPFSRLDAALREQFRAFVFSAARAENLPVLLVTHDEADAKAASGRIVPLRSG